MEETNDQPEPIRASRRPRWTVVSIVILGFLLLFGLGFLGASLLVDSDGKQERTGPVLADGGTPDPTSVGESPTPAIDPTTTVDATTTTEPPEPTAPRILRPGEVLDVPFGTTMTAAEPRLTEMLGPPTATGHGDFEGGECRITGYGDLWVAYFRPYVEPTLDYNLQNWLVTTGVDGWEMENGVTIGTPVAELLRQHPQAEMRDWDEAPWSGWNTTYWMEDLDFELDELDQEVKSIGSPWIEFCPAYDLAYHHEPGSDEVRADFDALVRRHCEASHPAIFAEHARRISGGDRHVVTTNLGSTVVYDQSRESVEPPGGPEKLLPQELRFCDSDVFLGTTSH